MLTKILWRYNGILKSLFGSSNSKKNLLDNRKELRTKTEKLRSENKAWESEFKRITELRKKAQQLEKEKKIDGAIKVYLESLKFSDNSSRLKFNNYSFDIQRIAILLSKTKQNEFLKSFLQEKIESYPNEKDSENWKKRLYKIDKS